MIALVVTTWLPSPDRDNWAVLLLPAAAIAIAQTIRARRLYGHSVFHLPFICFVLLCIVSIYTAPYPTRGWVLLYRPIAGFWILATWVDLVRTRRAIWVCTATAVLTLLVLMIGIGALQWTGKASRFSAITDLLPRWHSFWWWAGGLNVNEYAGAVTWVLPTLLGVAARGAAAKTIGVRPLAGIAAGILAALLFLSQSLSGIFGAAAGVALALVPARAFKPALVAAGVILLAGNLAVLLFPAQSAGLLAEVSGRPNVHSLEHRAVMWQRAQAMFTDHPLTGVGIAMYRQLRTEYATPGFEAALVPHPHNEALQFAADLGIPGLAVYAWLAIACGQAALRVSRSGTAGERGLAIAVVAGLFGHAMYALTDAIPIWDRFAFMFWWWLGLLAGLDAAVSGRRPAPAPDTTPSA